MADAPSYQLIESRLDNGLRLVVNEDHSVPAVCVNIWYGVGSRHEPAGRTGFAHLFEHLMFEGSRNVAKGEHFRLVNAAGGTLNGSTWVDRTNYFELLPSHHLELVLWLEADRMGGLLDALQQETLDNQRSVVKNERRQRMDNEPYGTWSELMQARAFPPGHPYHHSTIGSMADLDAARLEDAREFYLAHYGPDNAVLSVVGDVEAGAVHELVVKYFGGLSPRAAPAASPPVPPLGPLGEEVTEVVPDRVPVPRVFTGYRCPPFGHPDHDAVNLLAAVLGVGSGSRLHRELVLRRQLAAPTGDAMMGAWPFAGGTSLLLGDVLARDGVAADELQAAVHEVERSTVEAAVPPAELARARALLVSGWRYQMGSFDSRADAFSRYATLVGDPRQANDLPARLQAVTAEDLQRVAAQVLRPDNRVVLRFVPAAA